MASLRTLLQRGSVNSRELSRFLRFRDTRRLHRAIDDNWRELNNLGVVGRCYGIGPTVASYLLTTRHVLLLMFLVGGCVAEDVQDALVRRVLFEASGR